MSKTATKASKEARAKRFRKMHVDFEAAALSTGIISRSVGVNRHGTEQHVVHTGKNGSGSGSGLMRWPIWYQEGEESP